MTPRQKNTPQASKTCKRGHVYDGALVQCPVCKITSNESWREKNKEYLADKHRERYQQNRESVIAQAKKWAKDNPERYKAKYLAYGRKPEVIAKSREWRLAHPEYGTWKMMIQRCTNPKMNNYHNYGGRGITVCERWFDFGNFFADMGPRPAGKSLDRVDNERGYSKDNCEWVDRARQSRNTRRNRYIEFNGKKMCVADWAKEIGTTTQVLYNRLFYSHWSIERALTESPKRRG